MGVLLLLWPLIPREGYDLVALVFGLTSERSLGATYEGGNRASAMRRTREPRRKRE